MTQLPNQDLQKREGRQEIASSVNQGYDYKHSYLGAGNQRSSGSKPFLGPCKSHNMFRKIPWAPNQIRERTREIAKNITNSH